MDWVAATVPGGQGLTVDRWEEAEYLRQLRGGEAEARSVRRYRATNEETGRIVDEYIYLDENGQPYQKVLRRADPKGFTQMNYVEGTWNWGGPHGEQLPFHLPQLLNTPLEEPVFIAEGEKDAETIAALGLVATTNAMGAGKWTASHARWLAGRKCAYVLEDNDKDGKSHALKVAESLAGFVQEVRIVTFRDLPEKGDVSEWVKQGGTRDGLLERCKLAPVWGGESKISATPYEWIDPADIPRREWLYKPYYVGSYVGLTVAAGGSGKSSLAIVEALAMASGRSLLGVKPEPDLRVWYINLEDPIDELQRRIAAACAHYQVDPAEFKGRLFVDSGRTTPLLVARDDGKGLVINAPIIKSVTDTILKNGIDVVTVDPFVKSHAVSENDNNKIDQVVRVWTEIAEETGCAIMLIHHLRKTGGAPGTVDDGRGASALLAAARSARVINPMTIEEASGAEIPEADRWRYFRSDFGKSNLAPRAERATWYKMESVDLKNTRGVDWDKGDQVGVATTYQYPLLQAVTLSARDIERIRKLIGEGRWRDNVRSTADPWAGLAIAKAMGWDASRKPISRQITKLLKDLLADQYLAVERRKDGKRQQRNYIVVGPNAPDV